MNVIMKTNIIKKGTKVLWFLEFFGLISKNEKQVQEESW